jgi:hypothetical protein
MRIIAYSVFVVLLAAIPASAQQWGNIKGKVVWADDKIPEGVKVNVDKDQNHCLAKGALVKDELVIDPQSKGVKNVMVWLVAKEGSTLPINPKHAAVPQQKVVIDQPMCLFEPRVTMMRAGQPLEIKNSAPVTHNTRITGNNEVNGTINLTIPPGGNIQKTLKAEKRPLQLACDIHGWMGGRIAVFDHPYFALTDKDGNFEIKDAPAGDFLIYINHEKAGWLHTPRSSKGQPITIPAGGLDLGKVEMKAEHLK